MKFLSELSNEEPFLRLPHFGIFLASIVAILFVLFLAQSALEPPHVQYRICNGTKTNLENVNVLGFRGVALKPGEFSLYQEGVGLVSEVGISIVLNGTHYQTIFDDHMGPKLPRDEYTYAIVLEGQTGVRAFLSDGSHCE
jgi:hypothetical protein